MTLNDTAADQRRRLDWMTNADKVFAHVAGVAVANTAGYSARAVAYVVQGEHYHVPGCPITAHESEAGAQSEAKSLVDIMLGDMKWKSLGNGWEADLERLQDYHGAAHCWVAIMPLKVQP